MATALPGAPGYVGTFDYIVAPGFAAYGAAPEIAAALALTVHALWAPLTAVGLACYWLPSAAGNRLGEVMPGSLHRRKTE